MSKYKQQQAQIWANMGSEIANTLQMYMGQVSQNKLKQQESMDLALVQILSTGLADARKEISTLDTWLKGQGLYGSLKAEDKTSEFNDWIQMLKEGKVEDYEDLGEAVQLKTQDLITSIQKRQQIKDDFNIGASNRQDWASQFGNIAPSINPEDAFMLSGEPVYGEDDKFISFTPGSELAALFDPIAITNEITNIDSIIKGGPGALQQSKYNARFKNIAELKQYKKEQQGMIDNMLALGIDTSLGLDEELLKNEAYLKGFLEGKVDKVTAQKNAASQIQLNNARRAEYRGQYEEAEIGYMRAASGLAPVLTGSLTLEAPAGGRYNLNQYLDLARTNPNNATELQTSILNNIKNKYPLAYPYAQAILNEQLTPEDQNKTQSIKAVSDMYEAYITMNTAWEQVGDELNTDDRNEIISWMRSNQGNPLVAKYTNATTLLTHLRGIGFHIDTVGESAARNAYEIHKGSEINLNKYTENIIRMGNNSVLQSDVLQSSLDQEFDVYSALNNINPVQDANNNEMDAFLSGEATGEYIDRSNKLRDALGSSEIDQAADAIAEMFGVPTWENYNNVNDFKQEIINKIENQYGRSPKVMEDALKQFEAMWLNLVQQRINPKRRAPFGDMTMQGLVDRGNLIDQTPISGYVPGSYAPPEVAYSNPIEGLYEQLASVKESLNSLSVLGIGSELEQLEDIFDKERNK